MCESEDIKNLKDDELVKICNKFNIKKKDAVYEKPKMPVLFSHCNFKEKRMEKYKIISLKMYIERLLFEYETVM